MAEIKSIYAPQVEADLKKVYTELEKHHKLIIEMSKQSVDFYGGRQAGNPTELKNAVKGYDELVKKQKELEAQLKKLTEAKKQSNVRTSEEIVNQRALAQASDRQARSNSALVGAYARLNAEHQIAMQRVRDLTVQYGTQHKATVQAQRDFDLLDKKIKQADQAVRVHNRNVGNYRSALMGLGSSMRSLMGAFGLVGGVFLFAQAIRGAFQRVKEFDKATSDLAATMGKSKKEIKDLMNDAKRLGGVTKFTATEVTSLQKEYAKLGFSQREILKVTKATLDLASATDTELARSAEVAGATLRAFGLDAGEMQRVVDVMAKSFTTSALDMSRFAESMKYAAPIAKQAGVSIEFTTAMLGKLADAGIHGSMAGTSLRRILTEMAKTGLPTAEAFEKIAKQGMSVSDAMDEVGRTAQSALLVLADSKEQVVEMAKGLNEFGYSAQMANTQIDNLAGDITLMESAFDGFILSVENGQGPISKFFRTAIQGTTDFLEGMIKINETAEEAANRRSQKFITETRDNINSIYKTESEQKKAFESELQRAEKLEALQRKELQTAKDLWAENLKRGGSASSMVGKQKVKEIEQLEKELLVTQASVNLFKNEVKGITQAKIDLENKFVIAFMRRNKTADLTTTKAYAQAKSYEQLSKELGNLELLLKTDRTATKENTTATKDNAKAKEKQRELIVGSVEWLESEISKLRELQRQQSTTTDEFDNFNAEINTLVGTLDLLINKQKEVKKQSEEGLLSEEDLAKLSEQMESEADYFLEMAKEKLYNAKQIYDSFGKDFIQNAGLAETFKILEEGLSKFGDNWEAKAIVIMEATQEMFNFISNLSHAHFEQEYSDLERQKEISIQFAGDSTVAREEIEKEYERRRKEIQVREAKAKRSQAMFNIGIDMAQGIMRAWAQNPLTAPVMTAIIGALGVAQIAAVASQPLPQFWKGTDNAPEGFAEVGERGRELIKDGKSGQWRLAEKRSVDYLTKGSTVLTNANTEKVLNFHAFNKGLTNTLVENNIDFYPIESKIDKLTNAILNKESLRIINDSNGQKYYSEKNGQLRGLNNARLMVKQSIF
jgi:phage-related minor tail protein